jgi:ABC-type branched-subunit amino acid transport system substrate-binding protein
LAACGSSSSSNSSSSASSSTPGTSGGAKPAGEPLVAWTYTDVNTEGPSQKEIMETARVYQSWVNAHGGISGRPLEAHFCDAHGTPTGAAACAREAVAAHAIATVGSFTFTGDAVVPILEQAHTAQFGNCCALSAAEYKSPISFPMGNEPLYAAGLVKKASQQNCKHINAILIEGAEAYKPLMENAAKSVGTTIHKWVTLPAKARDYSPQIAEGTAGGADCLIMIVAETAYAALMPAFSQSGSKARMYGPQGNLSEKVVKGFESVTEGDIVGGSYPNWTLPAWHEYRQALKTYKADESVGGYNGLGGLGTWAAYEAFKQVVESMKAPVNNESFLKAAETATINLPGMVPPEDFSKPWGKGGGPKGFDRLMDRCAVYSEFHHGTLVPLGNEFEDVSKLGGGTLPTNCGKAF